MQALARAPLPVLSVTRPAEGTVVIEVQGSAPAVFVQLVASENAGSGAVLWSDNFLPLLLPGEKVTVTYEALAPVDTVSVFVYPDVHLVDVP